MRRSQTYYVEVFDQIPTYAAVESRCRDGAPAAAAASAAGSAAASVLAKMVESVEYRQLHPAAEVMLELGSEDKMASSACRSFHSL